MKTRSPIPLHFLSGLPSSGKTSIIKELLAAASPDQRIGVIQSFNSVNPLERVAHPRHRFEQIRSSSCVCCEIFVLFYEKILALLQSEPLDSILVELSHEADINQLKTMLQSTPLQERLRWGRTLISFDIRDRRFRPYAVMPAINRMINQADALIIRFSDLAQNADFTHLDRHSLNDKRYFLSKMGASAGDLQRYLETFH